MKSECGGKDFGKALQFLSLPSHVMECEMINSAIGGIGASTLVLVPIVCGRSNTEMEILKKKYFELYTKDLGQVLASELGGDLESLVLNCLQASEEVFDPDFHTDSLMKKDMETIYKAGQGKFGTNETGLFKILSQRPAVYLKTMNLQYADKYGFTIVKVLETELGGKVEEAATFMLGMKLKPYETIAKLIKTACAGFGTNELLLTCALIRYQLVMKKVMEAHIEYCKFDLVKHVNDHCVSINAHNLSPLSSSFLQSESQWRNVLSQRREETTKSCCSRCAELRTETRHFCDSS